MDDLFLGWDVGAWNCDRNQKSRDAMCAVAAQGRVPSIVGYPWRGNLRELMASFEGDALIQAMLDLLAIETTAKRHVTIAIDTPLAWPRHMIALVTSGRIAKVPGDADANPYLFRKQELSLFSRGLRPLSTVRDMIGSQSVKGIHFLKRARLVPSEVGVWSHNSTVAIETYPAAVRDVKVTRLTSKLFAGLHRREKKRRGAAWRADVRDAITCALVAWLHRRNRGRLDPPRVGVDEKEGWIWLPVGDVK